MSGMEFFGAEERQHVNAVLETGALFRYNHEHIRRDIWKARDLEREVRRFTGAQYAHAVSSGSTAVATMMSAAGLGFGDEVIVPPFTYVAPIEAVLLAGALPVFADIDETLCLSAAGIERAITPRTKAVLLVHMCGAAAEMDSIMAVCAKHDLMLVEDAGQALGAFHKGQSVGLFGKAGAFSFDYFKITTCGEGGVCITNNRSIHQLMTQISDHGHSHIGTNRGMETHPVFGSNYRISELNAAVGLAQMLKLKVIRAHNRKVKTYLKQRLSEIPELKFRNPIDEAGDSATFLNFFMPNTTSAQHLVQELNRQEVGGIAYWFKNMYHFINQWEHIKNLRFPAKLAIHHLGAPQDYNDLDLPNAQKVIGSLISINIASRMDSKTMEVYASKIIKAIKKIL